MNSMELAAVPTVNEQKSKPLSGVLGRPEVRAAAGVVWALPVVELKGSLGTDVSSRVPACKEQRLPMSCVTSLRSSTKMFRSGPIAYGSGTSRAFTWGETLLPSGLGLVVTEDVLDIWNGFVACVPLDVSSSACFDGVCVATPLGAIGELVTSGGTLGAFFWLELAGRVGSSGSCRSSLLASFENDTRDSLGVAEDVGSLPAGTSSAFLDLGGEGEGGGAGRDGAGVLAFLLSTLREPLALDELLLERDRALDSTEHSLSPLE